MNETDKIMNTQNTGSETLLLVDKPAGITSFDVIRILRRKLGIRKMGHSGTLDPFATGLLLIGINSGTKDLASLLKLDKTYTAMILLGVQTDTGDSTGKKLVEQSSDHITQGQIAIALEQLRGAHFYAVPKYSAIKVAGKKLYELARAGIDFETPIKEMTVYDCALQSVTTIKDKIVLVVNFHVASGTYIRTLGEQLGTVLGVPATLTELRRTSIGEYSVVGAMPVKWEEKWEESSGKKSEINK
jgi:tRNA pseudouridine55 synthase